MEVGRRKRHVQAQSRIQKGTEGGAGEQAVSLTTGEATNPMAEHSAFAQGRALLYVVQARAGHCAPPPAVNGAPTGT